MVNEIVGHRARNCSEDGAEQEEEEDRLESESLIATIPND